MVRIIHKAYADLPEWREFTRRVTSESYVDKAQLDIPLQHT